MPLHLLVKWEIWWNGFLQIQRESISNISSIPLFWFVYLKCGGGLVGGGGGGGYVFLAFYDISNISRKIKFWEYKKILKSNSFLWIILYSYFPSCIFTMNHQMGGKPTWTWCILDNLQYMFKYIIGLHCKNEHIILLVICYYRVSLF